MLDWFAGLVGYDASNVTNGRVLKLSREGEILWQGDTWEEAKGSYDSNMLIRQDSASSEMFKASRELGFLCSPLCLRISGNPIKFLQGHNILGPSVTELGPIIQAATRQLPESIRPLDCDSDVLPSVKRSRVDITVMVDLGDHQTVHDWLSHAALETRSRHGRAQQSGGTVYWGKNSTRWALKAYCKRCELEKHPPAFPLSDDVLSWAGRLLRIELVLRRPELKDRDILNEEIIWEFMKRVEVGIMKNVDVEGANLPRQVRDTFRSWLSGYDVRADRPRATFYWQRKKILDEIGIDISLTPTEQMQKLESSRFDRNLFDIEVLKSKVTTECPEELQKSLFGS